jgi:lipoprotein-anchoring transpeptidase ErfK/SrfK
VSHGCIRLRNSDIERLVHDVGLPLGTPVEIKA